MSRSFDPNNRYKYAGITSSQSLTGDKAFYDGTSGGGTWSSKNAWQIYSGGGEHSSIKTWENMSLGRDAPSSLETNNKNIQQFNDLIEAQILDSTNAGKTFTNGINYILNELNANGTGKNIFTDDFIVPKHTTQEDVYYIQNGHINLPSGYGTILPQNRMNRQYGGYNIS